MNVFVLSTGRCGSMTFAKACDHIKNYGSGHETRRGERRLSVAFPDNHIEVDNRLSWVLGRLDQSYGDRAFYVHLTRDAEAVMSSFCKRWGTGIIEAYNTGILCGEMSHYPLEVCENYIWTVRTNIELFLKDKTNWMCINIDINTKERFAEFWQRIGAEGDLGAALKEFDILHNSST